MSGNKNGDIKKMLLLRPEVYTKLMKSIELEQNMSALDRNMKAIFSDLRLSDSDKWLRYRQQLITHANNWRNQRKNQNNNNNNNNNGSVPLSLSPSPKPSSTSSGTSPIKPIVQDNFTQMHRQYTKDMETQTNQLVNEDDYMTSMNIINNARMDDEISNIDVDELTSPTNRLSLGIKNIGATSTASALKQKRVKTPAVSHKTQPERVINRALSFESADSDIIPHSDTMKPRRNLKRSATQPDQFEINFPPRKKIVPSTRNRVQSGKSIRNINWTRI